MNLTKITAGLVSGLVFGAGLAISGMTNPNKVLNFLDVTGSWDPSLALVIGAAVPVSALSFWLAKRRHRPLLEPGFMLPQNTRLEASLIVGSALFGIGWGLGGYCPGPAVASLGNPGVPLLAFIAAMGVGLFLAGGASALIGAWSGPVDPHFRRRAEKAARRSSRVDGRDHAG